MFSLLLRSSKDFVVLEGIQLLLLLLDFPNLFQKRPVIFEINLAGRVFLVRQLGGFRIFFGGKKPAIPREGDIRTTLSPGGPHRSKTDRETQVLCDQDTIPRLL
jgi:hypothetical protein